MQISDRQIFAIVDQYFPNRSANYNDWQSIVMSDFPTSSSVYSLSMVQYCISYFSGGASVNLSMVLYDGKHAVGVMPLIAHKNNDKRWLLSSNGVEIVEPLFKCNIARRVRKKLERQLSDLICHLATLLSIKQSQFVNMEYFTISSWHLVWAEKSKESFPTYHLLVDLSLSIEDIRLSFRKSYRPLVNKALNEFKIEVHEQVTDELFEEFRLLHKSVSGRATRSIESWDIQKKRVNSMESFLITLSDESDKLVGAGLFNCTKSIGEYAVGVYRRDLFDKPLGHAIQMKAIETLKDKGLRWYEIGQKSMATDKVTPTSKEISISHFKSGFSTRIIARQHLIIDYE